jgi:hypothetical protein
MKKSFRFTAAIGIGLALAPWGAIAQDQAAAMPTTHAIVPADQQPSRAQLDNLFEVMKVREQMASMTKLMPEVMQKAFTDQITQREKDHPEMTPTTEEQKKAAGKVMNKYLERVMNLYTGDEMLDDMAGLYQKYLTRSDVDAMIGFYSSPAGQHALEIGPVVMKEFMPMVMDKIQARIQPVIDELGKDMEQVMKPPPSAGDQPSSN